MAITIQVDNAAALASLRRLEGVPIRSKLLSAVRNTINDGKQEARARIIARYTAKSPLALGKTRSRVSGLTGTLTFSGKRNQIKKFQINPRRRINPAPKGGVFAQIVKGAGGNLSRAFLLNNGAVMERVGRPRLPIKNIKTIALPGMAKAVKDYVLRKMDQTLERSLQAL